MDNINDPRDTDLAGHAKHQAIPTPGMILAELSDREAQVLRLVADGHDTAEIAERLAYSQRTIKNVVHDIISRLQVRNRSHAVAYALRNGLI